MNTRTLPRGTLVMICPELPYPPTGSGNRVDIWGRVLFFKRTGLKVVLIICSSCEANISEQNNLPEEIELDVFYIRRRPRWSPAEDSGTVSAIQAILNEYRPLIVWSEYADFSYLTSALDLNGAKLWFYSHNFELAHGFEKEMEHRIWDWRGGVGVYKLNLLRLFGFLQKISAIYAAERKMHLIADRIFFISYTDKKMMSLLYGGRGIKEWVLPFIKREPIEVKDKSPLDVIYAGSNYVNNVNMAGAMTLLEDVIPAVQAAMPGLFRFNFIGKKCGALLGKYSSETVLIHDYVDNLIPFMQNMDIACLPIRLGWGCKVKMVEALASGLPVIGAPQTFRGVPNTKKAYFVCKKTVDYVEAFRLLADYRERKKLAVNGKLIYESWLSQSERLLADSVKETLGLKREEQHA